MLPDPAFRAEIERDPGERLSADDMATRHDAEFLGLALLRQRMKHAGQRMPVQGVCTNCEERCAPLAVYCDPFCREDHEARLAAAGRTGLGG